MLWSALVGALLGVFMYSASVAQGAVTADNYTARLAFFNYPWELDGIVFDDDGFTVVQEAMAPLAVLLFNERRADILPVLGQLGNCNKNLSIPYTCASGGNARFAFSQLLGLTELPTNFPHAV
jgi:hypothetical protein